MLVAAGLFGLVFAGASVELSTAFVPQPAARAEVAFDDLEGFDDLGSFDDLDDDF